MGASSLQNSLAHTAKDTLKAQHREYIRALKSANRVYVYVNQLTALLVLLPSFSKRAVEMQVHGTTETMRLVQGTAIALTRTAGPPMHIDQLHDSCHFFVRGVYTHRRHW